MTTEHKILELLNSPEAGHVKKIIAWYIRKSPTLTDDEIAANADLIAGQLAKDLEQINHLAPTDEEVKESVVSILEWAVDRTKTPWDNLALRVMKKIL